MTQLKIKVTKEDIIQGHPCNGSKCAISLAIRDVFQKAHVTAHSIFTGLSNNHRPISLPYEAQVFIRNFDKVSYYQRAFLPEFEFTITIPDEVINQINIEELRPLLVNHPTLELCE